MIRRKFQFFFGCYSNYQNFKKYNKKCAEKYKFYLFVFGSVFSMLLVLLNSLKMIELKYNRNTNDWIWKTMMEKKDCFETTRSGSRVAPEWLPSCPGLDSADLNCQVLTPLSCIKCCSQHHTSIFYHSNVCHFILSRF